MELVTTEALSPFVGPHILDEIGGPQGPGPGRFFDLADRLKRSSNPEEEKRLKEELARMIFGE